MARFYQNRRNSAGFAALLLVMLLVLAGQNTLSGFVSGIFNINVQPPCATVRQAIDRDQHQSLIAREAAQRRSPFRVNLVVGTYPTAAGETLTLTIVLTNLTVGTVPFVHSGGVPFNNPAVDGFGIVTGSTPLPQVTESGGFVPESNIGLLVPLQSCTETITLSVAQIQEFGLNPSTIIRAYYRNSTAGQIQEISGQPIYSDHGLWVGIESSREVVISTGN